ncbi:MAG: peptidase, partial [Candidatus Magasanikiibacteriota bacterium]
ASGYLISASLVADSPSMADFMSAQAKAFLTNDYHPSDEAWVKVKDSKFEVVIAPYETYEDRLFGYKACFEAYVTVTDPKLSADLDKVKAYLDDMEKKIPLDDQYRGYQRASDSPIFAVDLVYSAGEGRRGVQSSAFNLPNDEDVREHTGTKKVMLRNVQEKKFNLSLVPISKVVLVSEQQPMVTWGAYFWHNLLHELAHGMGPGKIQVCTTYNDLNGKTACENTTVSKALKDTFGPLEELKADALGFWEVGYLVDVGFFSPNLLDETAISSLAGFFRAVRFGADEAHGVNNLMYYNFFKEFGLYSYDPTTKEFTVDTAKFLEAANALSHEILTIEAVGNYEAAQAFMAKYGKMPPEAKDVLAKLGDIPVDLHPLYTSALISQ